MAKNPKGPGPSGRKYKGLPIPGWFQEESADALRSLKMRDDDVVCASLPKSGTTWVQKILYLMLHGLDDDGKPTGQPSLHAKGQVYPDALPLKAPEGPPPAEGPEAFRRKMFGDAGFEDLGGQPARRLFSTHLARGFLPAELEAAEGGRGRLVVVVRNLKDVLSSLHYFRGEAKDGWLGNEHGPGSLARFVATMHLGDKYVFDRSANVPEPMRGDFAMPPPLGTVPEWNHTALAVGARGPGLTWHRHKRALAILVHGRKRWPLPAPLWGLAGAPEPPQRAALQPPPRHASGAHEAHRCCRW